MFKKASTIQRQPTGKQVLAAKLVATLLLALLASPGATAQDELSDDREVEERREATQSMSELVYRRLSAVHDHLGEDALDEAMKGLTQLSKMSLNDYEEALVHQTYGFVYIRQDRQEEAIAAFERCLQLDALPNLAQQGMLYSLAGLYQVAEQYEKAIETMRTWFKYEADPPAKAYMVIGSSYTQLQKFDEALPYVQKAIEKSEEPKQSWYLAELAIHYQKERFSESVRVLKSMLRYWPEKEDYWDYLYGAHMQLDQQDKALDAMMVAYTQGLVTKESKILAVAQMNMALDIPFTAGKILEKEIAAGNVEGTKKNLEILMQAWLSAREFHKAIAVIDRLAPLSGDGEYYMRKANIYNELGEWQNAADAAEQALEAGVKHPEKAHMLAGMAYSELSRFQDSVSAFRRARQAADSNGRKAADAWIDFVQEKIQIANATR